MTNIGKIKGVLNLVTDSEDFFKEYCYCSKTLTYKKKKTQTDMEYGLLSSNTDESKFLMIPIPEKAYESIISYTKEDVEVCVPSAIGLLNIVANFFAIQIVCAYISEFDSFGGCNSSVVFLSSGKAFSIDANFYDITMLSMINTFPVFIKKEIFRNHGISRETLWEVEDD